MDPGAIGSAQWAEISSLIANLWMAVLSVILFATTVIVGVNSIPSLMASGHVPESLGKVRPVFYAVAVLFFASAAFFISRAVDKAAVLRDFWPVYWI